MENVSLGQLGKGSKHTAKHIKPYLSSDYLDMGGWGVLNGEGEIIVGYASRISEETARLIVAALNAYDPPEEAA